MDAHRRVEVRVGGGELDCTRGARHARTGNDELGNADGSGLGEDRFAIIIETVVSEVGADIDERACDSSISGWRAGHFATGTQHVCDNSPALRFHLMLKQLSLFSTGAGDWSSGLSDSSNELHIRVSHRAKRLTLQAQPPFGVELVVPKRARPDEVSAFVNKNRSWIEKTQEEIERAYPRHLRELPSAITLPAANRQVTVDIAQLGGGKRAHLRDRGDVLAIGIVGDANVKVPPLLRRWLMNQARRTIRNRAAELADQIGLTYSRLQVRTQRTRWGSCSSSGTVSINACSLFLDAALLDYLLIHELCHLRYLNHSARYWKLVGRHEPNYRELDRELGQAWAQVPAWALQR